MLTARKYAGTGRGSCVGGFFLFFFKLHFPTLGCMFRREGVLSGVLFSVRNSAVVYCNVDVGQVGLDMRSVAQLCFK